MYPRRFFDTYWGTHIRSEVFVAMPFSNEFAPVWKQAIEPAIQSSPHAGNKCLCANRVDTTVLSGNVVFNILDGIAHSTLVFVDISIAKKGKWRGQRNGNVMYEFGLAHAVRPETDLIVVRRDKAPINFDIANIHIHDYPETSLEKSREIFVKLIDDALEHRNKTMTLLIERANERLDAGSRRLMVDYGDKKNFEPFGVPMNDALDRRLAVNRLLDLGIIACEITGPGMYHYVWTEFGKEVYRKPNMASSATHIYQASKASPSY